MTRAADRLPRAIDAGGIDEYRRDGAAVFRGVVPRVWIEHLRIAIDRRSAVSGSLAEAGGVSHV